MAEPEAGLLQTLRALIAVLDSEKADFMLVGGVALAAFVPPRATTDIDVVVAADDARELAARIARRLGGSTSMRPVRFKNGLTMHRLLVPSKSGEVVIDLLLPEESFRSAAMGRRIRVSLPGIGRVAVATAEDLVLLKLAADRPQDRLDIRQLLEHTKIDRRYVAGEARRQGLLTRWRRFQARR